MARHAARPHEDGAADGELPDRPAAPDGDCLAAADAAEIRRHVAGGEDVGEKQRLLVRHAGGHFQGARIGIGHAEIFGLSACIAAQEVRIAEEPGGRMAPELRGLLRIGVRALAGGIPAVAAEEAFAAGDGEGDHHAVAHFQVLAVGANLDDLAHGLVAHHVAGVHLGDHAIVDVQVRAADGAGRDADDAVPPVLDARVRHMLAAHVMLAVPGDGFHGAAPSRGGGTGA